MQAMFYDDECSVKALARCFLQLEIAILYTFSFSLFRTLSNIAYMSAKKPPEPTQIEPPYERLRDTSHDSH